MTVPNIIVIARSGALLSLSPSVPGAENFLKYGELESIFPGLASQIDALLMNAAPGSFVHSLSDSNLEKIQLVVVEALAIQRVECDLVRVVQDALAPLERQALERDISLKFEKEGIEKSQTEIDPVKIAWLISALVGNSLRFVRSGSRHLPGGSIVVRGVHKTERGALEFRIQDDGPGIPAVVVDEILKQSAGHPPYRGVALQLARDIVQAHGGTFLVHSIDEGDDHGTTIDFTLPVEHR